MKIQKNYPLKKFTTMAIGGPAKYFVTVKSEVELLDALEFASKNRLSRCVVGEGSNLIVSDKGYRGVIIQNKIQRFEFHPSLTLPLEGRERKKKIPPPRGGRRGGGELITVGAGNNLLKFIYRLNSLEFSGMERMAGIPGTVGGAIYGCAGAYGQEIKDSLLKVRIFDGREFRSLSKQQCKFGYRSSIFKKRKSWVITEAVFRLKRASSGSLVKTSRDIIRLRAIKYKPGLKCPGSFFKNIKLADLMPGAMRAEFLKKIPEHRVTYGKIAAGYLLEEAGVKGLSEGSIKVAPYHANLIYNPNGGRAADVKKLAIRLKRLVKNKFGIIIEEEVQYLGF